MTGARRGPALSTTARAILAELAEAFPESAHFRGGRKLRKAGWEKIFPRIERDVEAKEEFLDAVEELCRIGVVSVKWRRFRDGTEVDALYLEQPERLFELLGRRSPETVRRTMLEILSGEEWTSDSYTWAGTRSDLLAGIRDYLRATLEASHPVPIDDPADLADLARLLRISPADAAALPIRAQSVRLYGDSKRLERLLPVVDKLSRRVAGIAVSEELGLARSYPEVSLALLGTLVFRGEAPPRRESQNDSEPGAPSAVRRWRCAGEVVTLPGETISSLEGVEFDDAAGRAGVEPGRDERLRPDGTQAPAALSVENKETFHTLAARLRDGRLSPRIRAVVYCGGHPHRYYVGLLTLLRDAGLALLHFGDLDPDGLFILRELNDALAVPVEPWLMDVPTYHRYLAYGYEPSAARLELLAASLDTLPASIRPLAAEIVRTGTGVEQEVIDVDDPSPPLSPEPERTQWHNE